MTGPELKELRKSLNLTQQELSDKIGARGKMTISEWEKQEQPKISKPFLILINLLKEGKL
jgi:transcriptional regulator with XRE-family HTH domain